MLSVLHKFFQYLDKRAETKKSILKCLKKNQHKKTRQKYLVHLFTIQTFLYAVNGNLYWCFKQKALKIIVVITYSSFCCTYRQPLIRQLTDRSNMLQVFIFQSWDCTLLSILLKFHHLDLNSIKEWDMNICYIF